MSVPDLICSTCGKRLPGDASSAGTRVLCPACRAAPAIATPDDAAKAKITTHTDASDGSFREGAPPPAPVRASLLREAIRGALIFAASGIAGAFMGSPCLLGIVNMQAAKSEGEALMILAVCLAPGLVIGAVLVGYLLRTSDSSYSGRFPVAGPAAFLVGALLGIPLAFASLGLSDSVWAIPITLILANATCGALFGAIRYSFAPHPPRPLDPRSHKENL
jgi:hypothetical protein